MSTARATSDPLGVPVDWHDLLDRAQTGEGLRTHFQPVVDLARGVIVGYEALTRFEGYPVSDPECWFGAARALDRSVDLEVVTLSRALSVRGQLPPDTFLAVNVGPEVLDHGDLLPVWRRHPDLHGVVVELTEHARIDSYSSLEPALDRLRTAGAMIAIDDAGAGYAGLQHLIGLRPHIIKLDRQVISGVDRDETKRALVEMIGTFASRIDASVLAEGIEHLGELDAVISLGVPLAQGYLLGRPALPWSALARHGADLLRGQPTRSGHSLHRILERTATAYDETAALAALRHHATDLVVVLDDQQRPLSTLHLDGSRRSALLPSTRVRVDTPVAEAAERAVTRPVGQRFHPLLCVDDRGRYVGVVRMERVLTYLTAHACRD